MIAVLRLEKGAEFESALKRIQEAKEKCLASAKPDENCHAKSQEALKYTVGIYDKILDEYRKRLPNRSSPAPRM